MPQTDKRMHKAALEELSGVFAEKLAEGGSVTFSPRGTSMLPMLRAYGDSVTLIKPPARFKKGMVALFVQKKEDGSNKYILHRLVKIKKEGLVFCGDHRTECDKTAQPGDVVGIVADYRSRGNEHSVKELKYRLYSFYMVHTVRFRRAALKLEDITYRIWKRLRPSRAGR